MRYWPTRPLYLRIKFDQQCGLPPADVWQPQQIHGKTVCPFPEPLRLVLSSLMQDWVQMA
jgi:hypothetical protein